MALTMQELIPNGSKGDRDIGSLQKTPCKKCSVLDYTHFFLQEHFKIRKAIFLKSEKYVSCIHLKKEGTLGRKRIQKFSK